MNLIALKFFATCSTASSGGLICGDPLPQPNTTGPNSILNVGFLIAFSIIGGVALLFLVLGGARYVFSQGKPEDIEKAKNQIKYAIIGLVIVGMATSVVSFLTGSL